MNKDTIVQYVTDKVKRRSLHRFGLEALRLIMEAGANLHKPVWLDYGTLLGAYREHDFIKHDNDIDLAMFGADFDLAFQRALYDRGFNILRQFTLVDAQQPEKRQLTEITLKYKQVQIDIFLKFQADGTTFGYLWGKGEAQCNKWKAFRDVFSYSGFKESDFLGVKVLVPENTEDFLRCKYGDDFMQPQPGWQPKPKKYLPLEECYGEVLGGWIG